MIAGTLLAGLVFGFLAHPVLAAQDAFVPRFRGRVFADGRPADWLMEVRLDSLASSTVATAYTLGSSEFEFRNVVLSLNENYILVIDEPGFEELRFELRTGEFGENPNAPGVFIYNGVITLSLERLEPEPEPDAPAGAGAVDIRQLTAEIPDEAHDEYERALGELNAGNDEAALEHLERAVGQAPEYYDALVKLGVEYLRAGRYSEAQGVLVRAHDINPNDPLPLTNLGSLHFQEGERLRSVATNDPEARSEAVDESYRRAVDVLEEAVRLDPQAPRANFYLGAALYRIGEYARAESLLVNALALDDRMTEARLTLLNVYTRQQRYDAALEQISSYLEANPDAPERAQLEALRAQLEGLLEQ